MRRAALLLALGTAAISGCAALTMRGESDPQAVLHAGVVALDAEEYGRARTLLEPLYRERWNERVGQQAMLALIAGEMDTRNPERRLWAAADLAGRMLNVPDLEPWMLPVAETYYLLALELGAQDQRMALADSASVAADTQADEVEEALAAAGQAAGRTLPTPPELTVPARIRQIAGERDALRQRLSEAEAQLALTTEELRETKVELERIKKTIKL